MPNKHNTARRHHIPKMSFKVQNWSEYEAWLRRRGSLTLWVEAEALDQWQSIGPNGQARYRDIAIQTCLMLRATFKMALRQTEGLMESVLTLMNLTISAPGNGWKPSMARLRAAPGASYSAVDADSGMIVAQVLTDQHTDDPSQVGPLLDQVEEEISKVIADGAYDGMPTYQTIALQHGDDIEGVIPPRSTAVPGTESNPQKPA